MRNEGFVVLTNDRLLCLEDLGEPPDERAACLARPDDIASVDYKRGVVSTITVVPTTGTPLWH